MSEIFWKLGRGAGTVSLGIKERGEPHVQLFPQFPFPPF